MDSPEDTIDRIADEFGAYYYLDDLPEATVDTFETSEFPERARDSAMRLSAQDAPSVRDVLQEAAAGDAGHPLIVTLIDRTNVTWNENAEQLALLQLILARIAQEMSELGDAL